MSDGRKNNGGAREGSGRKGYGDELRLLRLGGLCVDWAIDEMMDPNSKHKKDIVLKVLPNLYPRKIAGDKDNPLNVVIGGFKFVKMNEDKK